MVLRAVFNSMVEKIYNWTQKHFELTPLLCVAFVVVTSFQQKRLLQLLFYCFCIARKQNTFILFRVGFSICTVTVNLILGHLPWGGAFVLFINNFFLYYMLYLKSNGQTDVDNWINGPGHFNIERKNNKIVACVTRLYFYRYHHLLCVSLHNTTKIRIYMYVPPLFFLTRCVRKKNQ